MRGFFIKTCDGETAERLLREGFVLVSEDGGVYTFLNGSGGAYGEAGCEGKAVLSDVLCV